MSNRRRIRQLKQAAEDQDRRYFHAHPDADSYDRPATPDELAATGYPVGTMVHVEAVSQHVRVRMFMPPTDRWN